ncbi:MAG: chorismate synthase [Candidatus Magnetoovum sp. WYHC-5]|nr:chorismate synthase [Candidatus Magnetoovum sp. WYHC-5]
MATIKIITAGESHGPQLTGIIEGIPSNLELSEDYINIQLKRRQIGYGRGGRMKIESDKARILSGVRWGKTLGSPITLVVENKDWSNWEKAMSSKEDAEGTKEPVLRPRPGHADLAGAIKYNFQDIRNVLERSSARETAMRVSVGAVCRKLLESFGIQVGSFVIRIGSVGRDYVENAQLVELFDAAEGSPVRCPFLDDSKGMVELIDAVSGEGDSIGGVFEVFALNVPVGLGSYVHWDRRLEGRLAQALMSIQAVKGVEVGLGFEMARRWGSEVMDEIFYEKGFYRATNSAGGIEGGMSNGEPIVLRAAMKPIPTQKKPLRSVDISSKAPVAAAYERSDVCAVPACSVIAEAMVSIIVADALLEKFGGDSIEETKRNVDSYRGYIRGF